MHIEPLKSRDQYFLQDNELLDFEVKLAKLRQSDVVLEIGAGTGNLTRRIAQHAKVIAIEKDERFLPLLRQIENAEIVLGDAVKILQARRYDIAFNKIISNIPYSRSQDILVELLQRRWQKAVLCVQSEFAQKMQGRTKLGVAVNDCCEMRYMADVLAESFYPKAVDSSIIVLKQERLLDPAFWSFLGIIYRKKNRNAGNVLENAPQELARKKVHQLSADELRELYYRKL